MDFGLGSPPSKLMAKCCLSSEKTQVLWYCLGLCHLWRSHKAYLFHPGGWFSHHLSQNGCYKTGLSPLPEFSTAELPNATLGWCCRSFSLEQSPEGVPRCSVVECLGAVVEPSSCQYMMLYLYSATEGFKLIWRLFSQAKIQPMFSDISLRAF